VGYALQQRVDTRAEMKTGCPAHATAGLLFANDERAANWNWICWRVSISSGGPDSRQTRSMIPGTTSLPARDTWRKNEGGV
jgi:hypothetical protein